MSIGTFVRSRYNDLGTGKVLAIQESQDQETTRSPIDKVTVEYFCSVGQQITYDLSIEELQPIRLTEQTRCYLRLIGEKNWRVGRIFEWDEDEQQYRIDLPNGGMVLASESEIFVRCNLPIEDPMDILTMKGQETPYFHNQRSRFVRSLVHQQTVSQGLTGLLSANIELYPHQVEVVRRVLQDPQKRYWLGDSPGLGKTIEAGVILRQFLLKSPNNRGLIIAPTEVISQWKQELKQRFYLTEDRVKIVPFSELDLRLVRESYSVVIIDHAEEIAALAMSSKTTDKERYGLCKTLASKTETEECDRFLLLSGLSPQSPPEKLLGLLHLLNPNAYPLESLETFTKYLQKRIPQGQSFLAYQKDSNPDTFKDLKTAFPKDKILTTLEDDPTAVLHHLQATYRLHPGLVRNDRENAADFLFERNANPQTEYDLDERSESVYEYLEEWRKAAVKQKNQEQYAGIFRIFVQGSSTHLEVLQTLIQARLNKKNNPQFKQDFGSSATQNLLKIKQFDQEAEILQKILDLLADEEFLNDRLELLKILLFYHLADLLKLQSFKSDLTKLQDRIKSRLERPLKDDRFPKLVLFTHFTLACPALLRVLTETFGENAIATHLQNDSLTTQEENLQKFKTHPQCFLLLCDATPLTRRNLQFVEGIIHFDLPPSPHLLEQRLNPFDRLGGKMELKSWLLAGPELDESYQEATYQLLKKGLEIFSTSLEDCQDYLAKKDPEWQQILFTQGSSALLELIPQIQTEIEQEKSKINAHNALDRLNLESPAAENYFNTFDDYDADYKAFQKATEGWLCRALQFQSREDVNIKSALVYQRSKSWRRPTLVAIEHLKRHFAPFLDRPATYNRRTAKKNPKLHLLRLGDGLIDALADFLRWDDRGQAFALYRHEATWQGKEWLGFRFDYIVEMDGELFGERFNELPALKYLPPRVETVFLDQSCNLVTDPDLLAILQRPYSHKHSMYRDYNLAKERLPIIDEFVEEKNWETLCQKVRSQSEQKLCDRLTPELETLAQQATQYLQTQINRLQQRQNTLKNSDFSTQIEEIKTHIDFIQEATKNIKIRLDSVGFIVVSSQCLEE